MAARKQKQRNRKPPRNKFVRGKRRRRARKNAAVKALKSALGVVQAARNSAPRPRRKLPDAMRDVGLDENTIAECFAEQIRKIQQNEGPRIARKLLLDYLKECVRIVYAPARRGDAPERPPTIELVHMVPRPDRSSDKQTEPAVVAAAPVVPSSSRVIGAPPDEASL